MNVVDFCDGDIDVEEAVRIVGIISSSGIAAVEASGGGIGHHMTAWVLLKTKSGKKAI